MDSVKNLSEFNGFIYVASTVNDSSYAFDIRSKYTIVLGDSGTGKTVFVNNLELAFQAEDSVDMYTSKFDKSVDLMDIIVSDTEHKAAVSAGDEVYLSKLSDSEVLDILDKFQDISRSKDVIVKTNLRIVVLNKFTDTLRKARNQTWFQFLYNYVNEYTLICCDEDFIPMYSRGFQAAVQELPSRFIFITRKALSSLPYSASDVYELCTNSDVGITRLRHYVDIAKYNLMDPYSTCLGKTTLSTEDSKSGYTFFKSFLKNVKTSYSKCNIYRLAQSEINTVFCVDEFGFGCELTRAIKSIYYVYADRNNSIWMIPSFEDLILRSRFLNSIYNYQEISPYSSNREKDSTEILTSVLASVKLNGKPLVYNKSRIPACLYSDCCCFIKGHCNLYMPGNKHRLILGNELYELLVECFNRDSKEVGTNENPDDNIEDIANEATTCFLDLE